MNIGKSKIGRIFALGGLIGSLSFCAASKYLDSESVRIKSEFKAEIDRINLVETNSKNSVRLILRENGYSVYQMETKEETTHLKDLYSQYYRISSYRSLAKTISDASVLPFLVGGLLLYWQRNRDKYGETK